MRLRLLVLGLAIGLLGVHPAARAILIETHSGERVAGYLVPGDGEVLKINIILPDGTVKTRLVKKSEIKKTLSRIKEEILEKLAKDNPKAYRDYAVELEWGAQEGDPEARDMAMQLYLIAAYLDRQQIGRDQQFGRDALLSMSKLASTATVTRRFQAMAFLLDPKGDAILRPEAKPAPLVKVKTDALLEFLKAMQSYRMGRTQVAEDAARKAGDEVFAMAPGGMNREAFRKQCTDAICAKCKSTRAVRCPECSGKMTINGVRCTKCDGKGALVECAACNGLGFNQSVIDEGLRTVLRAELWAIDQLQPGSNAADKENAGQTKWSSILRTRQINPVAPLSLESLIEGFDPRNCLRRNGKWVAP